MHLTSRQPELEEWVSSNVAGCNRTGIGDIAVGG